MSFNSLLRKIAKAAPAIIANAPAIIAAVRDVKQAVKKPKPEPEANSSLT